VLPVRIAWVQMSSQQTQLAQRARPARTLPARTLPARTRPARARLLVWSIARCSAALRQLERPGCL